MMTRSGILVLPDNNEAPSLADMAVGLSRIARFAGQTYDFWSVAEHEMVTALIARQLNADLVGRMVVGSLRELHALVHDNHECATSDVPSSWKTDDMRALQRNLDDRIFASLGITPPDDAMREFIANCDRRALLAEAKLLAPPGTYQQIRNGIGVGGIPQLPACDVALDAVRSIKAHEFTIETAGTYYYGWVRRLLTKWRTNASNEAQEAGLAAVA